MTNQALNLVRPQRRKGRTKDHIVFPIGLTTGGVNDNKLLELHEYEHSIVFEEKINEEAGGMKEKSADEGEGTVKRKRLLFSVVIVLLLSLVLSGCALGHSAWWKEEVLLHDGQTIIVDRAFSRGGRHEIGQKPPIKEHSLRFTPPGSRKSILWKSEFDPTIGRSSLGLMALDIVNGIPYIATQPKLCLSYNKWGRPNPPYVFFKYSDGRWQQIPLDELPVEITQPNVLIVTVEKEIRAAEQQTGFVSADSIRKNNSILKEPQFRSIIRTPLKPGSAGVSCPELVYNGIDTWWNIHKFKDQPSYEACIKECNMERYFGEYCPCDRLFQNQK
jgi:hypothetical protein